MFDFFDAVDFPLSEPCPQSVNRNINIDHFIGAAQKPVGNRFTHFDSGGSFDYVIERFEMLDIDRRHHTDSGFENFQNIFVAFFIFRAFNIGMREFINQNNFRSAFDDFFDV